MDNEAQNTVDAALDAVDQAETSVEAYDDSEDLNSAFSGGADPMADFKAMDYAQIMKLPEKTLNTAVFGLPEKPQGWDSLTLSNKRKAFAEALGKEPTPKGTAVAKAKAHAGGDVLEPDLIASTAHEIENLTKEQAAEAAARYADDGDFNAFRLGGVLSLILANAWYDPHPTFKDYVEQVHGFALRKAQYLIMIYSRIVESGVPWSAIKHLGWTKVSQLAGILSKENLDHWLPIAEHNTVQGLIAAIKEVQGADNKQVTGEVKATATLSFKLHADQKETVDKAISVAREQSGTEFPSVALEFICLDYLNNGGHSAGKPIEGDLAKHFEGIGMEAVFEAFEKAFPNVNVTVEVPGEAAA